MTNREKYKEKLLDLCLSRSGIAIVHDTPCSCRDTACCECDMHDGDSGCQASILLPIWAEREATEEHVYEVTYKTSAKVTASSKDEALLKFERDCWGMLLPSRFVSCEELPDE